MPTTLARLRIAFVLPRTSQRPIGALKVIYEHADRLAVRGHLVTLVHPRQAANHPGADPHPWFTFRSQGARSIVIPRLAARWISARFDVVIATAWQTVAAVQAFPPHLGRKVYFLQDHESYMLGGAAVRAAMAQTFSVPWPLIVNSDPVQRLVESVARRRSHRIPCIIDTSAFSLDIAVDSGERQLIGFPARSERAKRTGDAVKALEIVRSQIAVRQQFHVWCFGSYPHTRLPTWITHYAMPTDNELRRLYNRTAIFLVPSLHEGFGLPGAEAMACGAALISTRNGGVNAYAAHGESALLCPAGDPQALADATVKLLSDPSLRHRIARNGAATVGCQGPANATDAFEAVLRTVTSTGNRDSLPAPPALRPDELH